MSLAVAADVSELQLLERWGAGRSGTPADRTALLLATAGVEPAAADQMTLGSVDALLLVLREALFGSRLDMIASCPACGASLQVALDLPDIRSDRDRPDSAGVLEVRSADLDVAVTFRLPTLADLRAIAGAGNVDDARRLLVRRCTIEARHSGSSVPVETLPDELVITIGDAMAAGDRQADVRLAVTCPDCLHAWEPRFDVGSFLWLELDAHSRRLLVDVHTLAGAYGWSESEIVALPAERRQAYLELVLG